MYDTTDKRLVPPFCVHSHCVHGKHGWLSVLRIHLEHHCNTQKYTKLVISQQGNKLTQI